MTGIPGKQISTAGSGRGVGTTNLEDLAVTNGKLAANAVTEAKIATTTFVASGNVVGGGGTKIDLAATVDITTSLNVGTGVTPSSDNGDAVFGDGSREWRFDSSGGRVSLTGIDAAQATGHHYIEGNFVGNVNSYTRNLNAGGAAVIRVQNDLSDSLALVAYGSTTSGAGRMGLESSDTLRLSTSGADSIQFATSGVGSVRWTINSAGNLIAGTDATYDIGADGATRPRRLYLSSGVRSGITGWIPGQGDFVGSDGTNQWVWDASAGTSAVSGLVAAGNPYSFTGSANGTIQFRGENTSAGSAGQAGLTLVSDTASGGLYVNSSTHTAGADSVVVLANTDAAALYLIASNVGGSVRLGAAQVGGQYRWQVTSAGHWLTDADNTYDIGASGATRPRTGYFGRSLFVGTPAAEPTDEGSFAAGGNFDGVLRNDLNNASAGVNAVASVKATSNVGGIQIRSLGSNHATLPAGAELLADSGVTGGLVIRTTGTVACDIQFNAGAGLGNHHWAIKSSLTASERGHFIAGTDNTYDIGSIDAGVTPLRPRTAYIGTSVVTPLVTNDGANLSLTTTTSGTVLISSAGLLDMDAAANLDIDVTGTFDLLATSTFSIDGTGASNVTATSGNLTLSTATSGDVVANAAGAVDIDAGTSVDILATTTFSIDGTGASNVSATSGNLTLSTLTSGTVIINSAGALDVDAVAASNITVTGANLTVETATSGTLAVDSAAALNLGVTNTTSIQIGRAGLSGATQIVDGTRVDINASVSGGGDGTLQLRESNYTDGNGGSLEVKSAQETLSALSGASASTTSLVPAGARLLFVTARVTTTITGATTFDVGDGTDVDRFGAAIALTAGTTVDHTDATADPEGWSSSTQDVTLTANGSNFTAGAVRIVAYYVDTVAPTS